MIRKGGKVIGRKITWNEKQRNVKAKGWKCKGKEKQVYGKSDDMNGSKGNGKETRRN